MGYFSKPLILTLFWLSLTSLQSHAAPIEAQPELSVKTQYQHPNGLPIYTNSLVNEISPYLRQHAHNPIEWNSWSAKPLKKAKETNRPVFISIGYSTCHWCHVMAEESFDNETIATLLNERFISIKIDREQHPAIDSFYMQAATILKSQRGWPLTILATPDGMPFFISSYLTTDQLAETLNNFSEQWQKTPQKLQAKANEVQQQIADMNRETEAEVQAVNQYQTEATVFWMSQYDEFNGGFGNVSKFPNAPVLEFLLYQSLLNSDSNLYDAILHTLNAMMNGAIHDQLDGGFHRYTIDPEWQTPHFEKMLYDQAQLARLYCSAYAITGDPEYSRTLRSTLQFIEQSLQAPNMLFYSAIDAGDKENEGAYYQWYRSELASALTEEEFDLTTEYFGLNNQSEFEGPYTLTPAISPREYILENGINTHRFIKLLKSIKAKLATQRKLRPHPHIDKKIITSWNAITISMLGAAAKCLDDPDHLITAKQTADALWSKHKVSHGLLRDSVKNRTGAWGTLEDYAQFALSNLDLYDLTQEKRWLKRAEILTQELVDKFWDQSKKRLFLTEKQHLTPFNLSSQTDSAKPGGHSLAYGLFLRMSTVSEDLRYPELAKELLNSLSTQLKQSPEQFSHLLKAHLAAQYPIGSIQSFAKGSGLASLEKSETGFKLALNIEPGWHLTATSADQKLKGLKIKASWAKKIDLPKPKKSTQQLSSAPMWVYQRQTEINLEPNQTNTTVLLDPIQVELQACGNNVCLAPETLYFSPRLAE
ncbi:thioredoxin domain-containing protein [Neptuniibacter caesariensis]|uniref:Spermatogenesis-associated protein 20-like TRX domain-containing protein n=1 Tax=Neptuniibacter caesariensis TaxID=207954 RepID=A0A7U8GSX5_NEPCE|nr:thioredoxin domain-containing protein [Neptuniibacter caesariensis]EAR61841.1 hypothetical protein MED92_02798 [Oceanospirillum sp. MED92] [Neptuniibacter caesariensis]